MTHEASVRTGGVRASPRSGYARRITQREVSERGQARGGSKRNGGRLRVAVSTSAPWRAVPVERSAAASDGRRSGRSDSGARQPPVRPDARSAEHLGGRAAVRADRHRGHVLPGAAVAVRGRAVRPVSAVPVHALRLGRSGLAVQPPSHLPQRGCRHTTAGVGDRVRRLHRVRGPADEEEAARHRVTRPGPRASA